MSAESPSLTQSIEEAYQYALQEEYIPTEIETAILNYRDAENQTALRAECKVLLHTYGEILLNNKKGNTEISLAELVAAFLTSSLLVDLAIKSALYDDDAKAQATYFQLLKEHAALPNFLDAATGQTIGSTNPFWLVMLREIESEDEE